MASQQFPDIPDRVALDAPVPPDRAGALNAHKCPSAFLRMGLSRWGRKGVRSVLCCLPEGWMRPPSLDDERASVVEAFQPVSLRAAWAWITSLCHCHRGLAFDNGGFLSVISSYGWKNRVRMKPGGRTPHQSPSGSHQHWWSITNRNGDVI